MNQENRRMLTINGLYALVPLLLLAMQRIFANFELQAYSAEYNIYMLLVEFAAVVLPALIWMMTPHGRSAAGDIWRKKPTAAILLIVPLALCAYFFVNGITAAWFVLLNQFGIMQMQQTLPAPQSGAELGIGLILVAVSPAVCEEFFFRGVLQPALHKHMRPWLAIVLGGCLFGLAHGQILSLPSHVLLGMMLCFVAYWTRSLWYTLLWHLLQNGMTMVITFVSEGMMETSGIMDASAAMITEQPQMMLMSAVMLIVLFGAGVLLLLALFLYVTKKEHNAQKALDEPSRKVALWTYAPLIAAAGGILYMYISGTLQLMGGV